jgi:hypothetical protein
MSKYKRIYLKYKTEDSEVIWYVARNRRSLKRHIKDRNIKNEDILCITSKRPVNYYNQSSEDILQNIEAYEHYFNLNQIQSYLNEVKHE